MFKVADKNLMTDPGTANCRIYVGNLNNVNVCQDDLEELFQKYGNILGINLNRGFGFIQFENEQSARDAIQGENQNMFSGRKLLVRQAVAQAETSASGHRGGHDGGPQGNRGGVTGFSQGGVNPSMNRGPQGQPAWNNAPDRDNAVGNNSNHGGMRGRGGIRGRGGNQGGFGITRDRSPLNERGRDEWHEKPGPNFYGQGQHNAFPDQHFSSNSSQMSRNNFPSASERPISGAQSGTDRNDCEIIVVSKVLTEYAEYIETRLKRLGLTVDLLFPNEDVPIGRVLANISSRGCLYAILVMPQNEEHRSLTLNILHGIPQEHRNMPVDDAINLVSRNFENYMRGDKGAIPTAVPIAPASAKMPSLKDRHPDAVQSLLNLLADNRQLTVLQYDRIIRYLQDRRELQVKLELGDSADIDVDASSKTTELQHRILSILNSSNSNQSSSPSMVPDVLAFVPAPQAASAPTPLLNDPTVQKALDSLLSGNLLQNITGGNSRF